MSGNRRKNTPHRHTSPAHDSAGARHPVAKNQDAQHAHETTPANQSQQVQAAPLVNAAPKAGERIGDALRRARLDRNEDLYQIAEYLCIKPAFLVALENSNYDQFAADAYVIGFLRTYASFLGLNGKEAVDRYRYEMAGRRKSPVLAMPVPMSEGRTPSGIIIVGATIAALLVYALWYGISSANRTEVTVAPALPLAQQTAPAGNEAADGLTAPLTTTPNAAEATAVQPVVPPGPDIVLAGNQPPVTSGAAPANAPKAQDTPTSLVAPADADTAKNAKGQVFGNPEEASPITIRATQSSWIMVTDDSGKAIFDHVLKPGDVYKVPNKPGLSLTTGNGNGITLSLNGSDLPKISTGAPHVVRGIPLDPDRLALAPSSQ